VKKNLKDVKIVLSGAGAAGNAVVRLLIISGAKNIIAFDSKGVIAKDSKPTDDMRKWLIENTNPNNEKGTMSEVLKGADVFIGVSAPNILKEENIAGMAKDAIVFALANPDPEIDPALAAKHARIVATGRSDYPNQINNVLAFPGLFRGLLDAGVSKITDEMLAAAAVAIASCVSSDQLNESFIIPSVFDPAVTPAVSSAIFELAKKNK
jgi:malate dehydrogenase (oxaloacetate-decarboxylating)